MSLQEGADGLRLVAESPVRWRLERRGDMRVPGVIFATERLLADDHGDHRLEQITNVATLTGIEGASYAMPDVHWSHGFPIGIGGVAATDVAGGGAVSPGGAGFDAPCGVRVLTAPFDERELQPPLPAVMDVTAAVISRGMGRGAVWQVVDRVQPERTLADVAVYAVPQGHRELEDLERCGDGGRLEGADPGQVSERACRRGLGQVGWLGSGDHFLEVQVDEVRAGSLRDLPAEAPYAYEDVEEVVQVRELAGLSRPVARMRPMGVVKG